MSPIPLNVTRIAGREFHEMRYLQKASTKTGTTTVTLERGCLTMVVNASLLLSAPIVERHTSASQLQPSCSMMLKSAPEPVRKWRVDNT